MLTFMQYNGNTNGLESVILLYSKTKPSGTAPAPPSGTAPAPPSGTAPAPPSGTAPPPPSGTAPPPPSGTAPPPAPPSGTAPPPPPPSGTAPPPPSGTAPAPPPPSGTAPAPPPPSGTAPPPAPPSGTPPPPAPPSGTPPPPTPPSGTPPPPTPPSGSPPQSPLWYAPPSPLWSPPRSLLRSPRSPSPIPPWSPSRSTLSQHSSLSPLDSNIKDVLRTLHSNVLFHVAPPTANRINVVRTDIVESAFRAFKRKQFNPKMRLDVVFVDTCGLGEGAVDNGGPTREFLTLVLRDLLNSHFFVGPASVKNLGLDSIGLSRGTYRIVGMILSVCLVHGGLGPPVFSNRLLCQLIGEPSPPVDIMEVDDADLRQQLQKIQEAKTVEETREAANVAANNLSLLGSLTVIRTLSDRDDILSSSLNYYLEGRLDAPLRQLKEGLETLGVLQALKNNPCLRDLFVGGPPAPLTAKQITDLFKVCYSEKGSTRRVEEERAVGQWRDWLIDLEGGDAVLPWNENIQITLEDVLMFSTGTNRIPPHGFDELPTLGFLHADKEQRQFPEANTCGLILRLPIHSSYEKFNEYMISGVVQSPHFGIP
nr:G2/M phase-specific E3 ubiquitin-protein ligase-like isoform X1 [Misgurnus anguillicaudatus]